MSPFPTSKGHLNPGGPVAMTRLPAGPDVADLVRHYWIPQWDLPAGEVRRQVVLGYPACNLVVQGTGVSLAGPTTRVSHRDLSGRGWAVAALLRPAAGPPLLCSGIFGAAVTVAGTVDRELVASPAAVTDLVEAIGVAMSAADLPRAATALERFLLGFGALVTADGLLANRLQQWVEASPARRVDEVASALAVSSRTLQRLARRYVGITPAAMIRRRRLQDAADALRADPEADLASVAVAHGYADHAHLTREFRDVLGFTPSRYRADPNDGADPDARADPGRGADPNHGADPGRGADPGGGEEAPP